MEICIIKLRVEGNYEGQNEENKAIEREEADHENDGMFGVRILNLFNWKYFAHFFPLIFMKLIS